MSGTGDQQQQQQQGIDLDSYLCVLERDQLERLVVRMLVKDDSNFADLERAASRLDEAALLDAIEAAAAAYEDGDELDVEASLQTLSPWIDKATAYAKIGLVSNAVTVLANVTSPIVVAMTEGGLPDAGTDERAIIETHMQRLELAWAGVVAKFVSQAPAPAPAPAPAAAAAKDEIFEGALMPAPETLDGMFTLLAEWRTALTPVLGPVFSDALRAIKKAIIAAGAGAGAGGAPAAAPGAGAGGRVKLNKAAPGGEDAAQQKSKKAKAKN